MTVPRSMPDLASLRARLAALPLDRAPLRRAGLLTALLVVLLVAGKAFGPSQSAAQAPAERNGVQATAEKRSAWTGGRVLALLLLAGGAGGAWMLHRRGAPAATTSAAVEVIETHTLAPGQTLRLVACGDDVMLLSATSEAIRLLRHWPRARFDRETASFADLLACAEAPAADLAPASPSPPEPHLPLAVAAGESFAAPVQKPVAPEPAAPKTAAPAPVATDVLALTSLQRLHAKRSAGTAPVPEAAPGTLRQFQSADV